MDNQKKQPKVFTPENMTCSDVKHLIRSTRPCYSCKNRDEEHCKNCPPQLIVERAMTCVDFYYQFFGLKKTHKSLSQDEKQRIINAAAIALTSALETSVEDPQPKKSDDDKTKLDVDYDFSRPF